jgi:hypothetical protein
MVIKGVQFSLDTLYAASTNLFDLADCAIGEVEAQMLSYASLFGVGVMRC